MGYEVAHVGGMGFLRSCSLDYIEFHERMKPFANISIRSEIF